MNTKPWKKVSWKAWATLRAAGILVVLGAGANLLHAALARGESLDQAIRRKTEEAETRIDQGFQARQFHENEESRLGEIEKQLAESIPADPHGFKAFCLGEAQNESLELTQFKSEKPAEDRAKSPKAADKTSYVEIPFVCQGKGSYGGILRFADRVHTYRGLVCIDRFGISRSSVFQQYLGTNRNYAAKASEEEFPADSHSFVLEGRVIVRPEKESEEN